MTAQVLYFNVFSKKDPHLNAIEYSFSCSFYFLFVYFRYIPVAISSIHRFFFSFSPVIFWINQELFFTIFICSLHNIAYPFHTHFWSVLFSVSLVCTYTVWHIIWHYYIKWFIFFLTIMNHILHLNLHFSFFLQTQFYSFPIKEFYIDFLLQKQLQHHWSS